MCGVLSLSILPPKRYVAICQATMRLLPVQVRDHFTSFYGLGYKQQGGNENKLLTFWAVLL
jgi:hypothetical protein